MHSLEFSLQVLVDLKGVPHVVLVHELVGDLQGHQELGGVGLSLQIWQSAEQPVQNVLQRTFLSMHNVTAIVGIEITGVAQHLEEAADALLSLLLGLFLHVNGFVCPIEVGEDAIHELKELKRCLVIELYHRQVAHERRTIETIHDQFDLLCVQVGRLAEDLAGSGASTSERLTLSCYTMQNNHQ